MKQGKGRYDDKFFANIHGSADTSAQVVVPILLELTTRPIRSIVDLGCGTGSWLRVAQALGVTDVIGVDGAYVPSDQLVIPPECFQAADLTKPVTLGKRFDLAISLEVGEHLPEPAATTLVRSLCSHSDIVAFSAAVPGQGGEGHVNEQPASYWARLFQREGYQHLDLIRPRIWDDSSVMFYYRQNLIVYANHAGREGLVGEPNQLPLDVIHPDQLAYWRNIGASEALPVLIQAIGRTARRRLQRLR